MSGEDDPHADTSSLTADLSEPRVVPAVADATEALERGDAVGRYIVLSTLGMGGMGVVYAAYDAELDRKVAVKVLRTHLAAGQSAGELRARLLREAKAMARLSHPNVVAIHDAGTFRDSVFLAMDLVEGTTLRGWLSAGPRPIRETLQIFASAGRGLAAAHAAGLVHRDFKPENVLIRNDGRVLVGDFGIARTDAPEPPTTVSVPSAPGFACGDATTGKLADTGRSSPSLKNDAYMTMPGTLVGTVGFMALEQVLGERVDARCDQFAFCVSLYFALYGVMPFRATSVGSYVRALRAPPTPPARAAVPARVRRVIQRGLSPRPDDRFPSMDALLAALEGAPAKTRWGYVAVAFGAALLAVGWIGAERRAAREVSACAAEGAELSRLWDEAARRQVADAFATSGAPTAKATFERVARRLDAYASAWGSVARGVCEASRTAPAARAKTLALERECLERQRMDFGALLALLRRADAQAVAHAAEAAQDLTEVAFCESESELRLSVPLPEEPSTRARVLSIREKVAEATALRFAGNFRQAAERARSAVDDARPLGQPATYAETLFTLGNIENAAEEIDTAVPLLSEAVWVAYAARYDRIVVRASTVLIFALTVRMRRFGEAKMWSDLADATLERIGGDDRLAADLRVNQATMLDAEGRHEEALAMGERAAEMTERAYGDHQLTAIAFGNLASTLSLAGPDRLAESRRANEHARDIFVRLYGPDHGDLTIVEDTFALLEHRAGHHARAIAHAERVLWLDEHTSGNGFWSVYGHSILARALLAEGDTNRALASATRANAIVDGLGAGAEQLVPEARFVLGRARLSSGDAKGALTACRDSLELLSRSGPPDPNDLYSVDPLTCIGEALLALGRADEALAPLERSVTFRRRPWPEELPLARFALARARRAAHRARADWAPLAEQAKAELEAVSGASAAARTLDAWLLTARSP